MLLVKISWAEAIWGLPFLTVLCPSERHLAERNERRQNLTERAWLDYQISIFSTWRTGLHWTR